MRERTRINVDASEAVRPFNRFWRGTGFSPAELLLEPEMRQMLAYIGGLPNEESSSCGCTISTIC